MCRFENKSPKIKEKSDCGTESRPTWNNESRGKCKCLHRDASLFRRHFRHDNKFRLMILLFLDFVAQSDARSSPCPQINPHPWNIRPFSIPAMKLLIITFPSLSMQAETSPCLPSAQPIHSSAPWPTLSSEWCRLTSCESCSRAVQKWVNCAI